MQYIAQERAIQLEKRYKSSKVFYIDICYVYSVSWLLSFQHNLCSCNVMSLWVIY